ncbi:MAG: putative quinol monooxygenase [Geminicoccaceae bacterium]
MATSPVAGPLVIIAEFEVKPGRLEAFLERAEVDSRHSVADEPGCRQFTVTVDREQPDRVVLFEVYDDAAAFDAHLETPHLKAFRAGIEPLVVSRQIRRLTRVHG